MICKVCAFSCLALCRKLSTKYINISHPCLARPVSTGPSTSMTSSCASNRTDITIFIFSELWLSFFTNNLCAVVAKYVFVWTGQLNETVYSWKMAAHSVYSFLCGEQNISIKCVWALLQVSNVKKEMKKLTLPPFPIPPPCLLAGSTSNRRTRNWHSTAADDEWWTRPGIKRTDH